MVLEKIKFKSIKFADFDSRIISYLKIFLNGSI